MDSQNKSVSEVRDENPATSTKPEEKVPAESSTKPADGDAKTKAKERADGNKKAKKHTKKHDVAKHGKTKKQIVVDESSSGSQSDSGSDGSSSCPSDTDTDDSESESEDVRKKRSGKKRQDKSKKKVRSKKQKKQLKSQPPASDSDSDSESSGDLEDSDDEKPQRRERDLTAQLLQQIQQMQQMQQLQQVQQVQHGGNGGYQYHAGNGFAASPVYEGLRINAVPQGRPPPVQRPAKLRDLGGIDPDLILDNKQPPRKEKKRQKASRLDYKRVDQVWDNQIHNYKLQDTAEGAADSQYDEFIFHVRRTFDWEGKYKDTVIDIKSKLLSACLEDVMGGIKGLSLVEDTPKLDPNMLFLYLEDMRKKLKTLKQTKPTEGGKRDRKKEQKRIDLTRQHLKILVKYIDKDYAEVKNSLYPMLENGLISFDLLWALWKPDTLAYTTTYGSNDEPRVFKVELAEKHFSILKGDYYYIEGKYFEYDGKQFGYGNMSEEIGEFRGARKITSLNIYPLKYHKNESQLRKDLIERGKKFVELGGVNYKSHQGMAYYKKKKSVIKVNINGRIMIDPSIHRRINPNYPISVVRPKDHDIISDDEGSDGESNCCGCGHDSDDDSVVEVHPEALDGVKFVTKAFKDEKGKTQFICVPKTDDDEGGGKEKLDQVTAKDDENTKKDDDETSPQDEGEDGKNKKPPVFTDEEYLIASPIVLGFAFAEKLWLELTVSGVKEIQWNETAYESLVLETKTKDIVKALVESHKYHAAESIDDVIQGKGKGLVAVLHGPPGTGKTLTAEGISELLKCPLYMVSAGELGTDSRFLETELQKILDICHAWGAILLLDEADVFLEKRNMQDIHRNTLVSIFLRQLEYFQGILFLTTNRVETFDDAFQSRIHIALRYDNLDHRAKKAIFKIFVERVRVLEKVDLKPFTDEDYNVLARHELNGRQIKNTVRTAQALAVNKSEPLSMGHIRQVLEVQMNFDRDLKGGTGYQDAMRSYF